MVDLSKFTFNKKILSKVIALGKLLGTLGVHNNFS